jgi:hypothetical protein
MFLNLTIFFKAANEVPLFLLLDTFPGFAVSSIEKRQAGNTPLFSKVL